MGAALRIARKDLKQRFRDRSVFLWGIVAPLGLAAIFSLLFGGLGDPAEIEVSYAVADLDGGSSARAFVDGVLGSIEDQGLFDITEVGDPAEAERLAADGNVDASFVVPAGFSAAVEAGDAVSIEVIGNVDSPTMAQVAQAIAGQFAGEINAVGTSIFTFFAVRGQAPDAAAAGELIDDVRGIPTPITIGETDEAASKQLGSETFYSAGMSVLFLFLTVQFGILGLLEERNNGTMSRLLAAPIARWSIIGGKAITSFVIGILSMTLLVVATTQLLGAAWGNSLGVALLVLAAVFAALGIMFVLAAFAKTAEQAGNLQSIVAFLLAMLGGTFFPVAQAGGWLENVSLLTPHAWFLRGLGDLAAGGSPADAVAAAGFIAVFGLVTLALGMLGVRRVVRP
jgi:ABC-2 type transport system permease protein